MKQDRRIDANLRMGPRYMEMYFFPEIFPNRRVAVCFFKYALCDAHLQHFIYYLV